MVLAGTFLICGTARAASRPCKHQAVQIARIAAPEYNAVFDLNLVEETPDLVTYEVTLSDVVPDPNVTVTVETTLSKTTCSLIEDPVKR
jgi:hypothetical protein